MFEKGTQVKLYKSFQITACEDLSKKYFTVSIFTEYIVKYTNDILRAKVNHDERTIYEFTIQYLYYKYIQAFFLAIYLKHLILKAREKKSFPIDIQGIGYMNDNKAQVSF